MKPHELQFNYLIDMTSLACEFESEGKDKNTLTKVELEGFKLDQMDLTTDYPELYDNIIAQMKKESTEYWDELKGDQIEVFKKLPNLHPLNFFLPIFLLLPFLSIGQASLSFGTGYTVDQHPTASIEVGYTANNIYGSIAAIKPLARDRYSPTMINFIAGYEIGQLTPFIAASYQTIGGEAKVERPGVNGWKPGGGIKYSLPTVPVDISSGVYGDKINISVSAVINF